MLGIQKMLDFAVFVERIYLKIVQLSNPQRKLTQLFAAFIAKNEKGESMAVNAPHIDEIRLAALLAICLMSKCV